MGLPEKGGQIGGERIDKLLPLWAVVPREWSTGRKVLAVRVGARAPGWRGRDEAAANRAPGRGPRSRIMVKEAGSGQRVRVEGERWAGA